MKTVKRDLRIRPFWDREKSFSSFWFEIVKTRFVLCALIIVFGLISPKIDDSHYIFLSIFIYLAFNLSFGLFNSRTLRLKRFRIVPEIGDVAFISLIVHYAGGPDSSWFLLYLFPIMSVSRYLGYKGCITLATLSTVSYTVLNFYVSDVHPVDLKSFALRVLVFWGLAAVAGNLTRTRQIEEEKLMRVFEEIDKAILSRVEIDKVLSLIMTKAMEFTNSDMGQMMAVDSNGNEKRVITAVGQSQQYEWGITPLTESYSQKVIDSQKSMFIATIKRPRLRRDLGPSYNSYWPMPRSALFVPLVLNSAVIGVIAVYSGKRFHYTKSEAIKLGGFAPLIALAQKSAELYRGIASAAEERKDRLKMLRKIAVQLEAEQGLQDLFNRVVDLTYSQLNSEEAALFISGIEDERRITKVAVRGPSPAITRKLRSVERTYEIGQSLAGGVFQSKKPYHSNEVFPGVEYVDDYSQLLPSEKISHYVGVPLIIGEEVLGVIRVINKRSTTYSLERKIFELAAEGFDGDEDVELMQTIASQVSSAIRNAQFIETHSFFRNLVANSPDPIIVLDEKDRIKVFNNACEQILGLKFEEVKDNVVKNYYESKLQARKIGKLLLKAKNSKYRIQNFEAGIRDAKAEIIPVSLSASLLFDKSGKRIGSIGIFKDLREIRRLQDEKTQAEKLAAIGKLTQTVGHDIKHHIATVKNYIEPLAYDCEDDELSRNYEAIQDALNSAVYKLQNMLMTSAPKTPEKSIVRIDSVFQDLEESMRRRANGKNVEFLRENVRKDPRLMADTDQLRQVFSNLFDNSLDAIEKKRLTNARENGSIELSAQVSGGWLRILWKDNGCGVSRQSLSRIFTPFFTNKETGNGLGLFIVKNVVENHGGNISVQSEEGEGTTFRINLPLLRES